MNGLQRWYRENYIEITWFIIGWLSLDMLEEFGRGNLAGVALDAALIALNYFLSKR